MKQKNNKMGNSGGLAAPPQAWTEETLGEALKRKPRAYREYQKLPPKWRADFQAFCQGKKTLPLIYDPFFKYVFDPDIHPERLERFISSILEHKVRIRRSLTREDSLLDGETYLVMDLLVELEDKSLVNVEIQKHGYAFPVERMSCYAADLLLRQYAKARGERGKFATYGDIKSVCVIVLFENSTGVFHACPDTYLHHGEIVFNTGLPLKMLTSYHLVALDVFRKIAYAKGEKSEQKAWLSLLVTEDSAAAEALAADYPWLKPIYQEIAALRRKPEEVLGMWSEALRILDENSMKYYVDQLREDLENEQAENKKHLEALEIEREENERQKALIREKDSALSEKEQEIAALKRQLAEKTEKS